MANYSVLKAAVQAVIKTNGNQEITGANMQSTLISIINSLGTGYQFMGVATPSTSPGTPDYNVAYIGGAGTYANFGTSVTVPVGSICVFKYNGSWVKEQITIYNEYFTNNAIGEKMCLIGDNSTFVNKDGDIGMVHNVIAGHTYRIVIINPDIDMSGVPAIQNSRFAIFVNDSTNPLVNIIYGTSLQSYYDVTIPTGKNTIWISCRATKGAVLNCYIYDLTRYEDTALYSDILKDVNILVDGWIQNYYIPTLSVGDTLNLENRVYSTQYECIVLPCVEDDVFLVNNKYGGGSARAVCFIDASYKVLSQSGAGTITNTKFYAPANSAFVVFNNNKNNTDSWANYYSVIENQFEPNYLKNYVTKQDVKSILNNSNEVDLILFAGQSNMAGRGTTTTQHPEGFPLIIDGAGYEFRAISDPTKLYKITEPFGINENNPSGISETNKTGSLVTSFVNSYYTQSRRTVVGVSASKGGTTISQWQTDGTLLPDAIQRFSDAITFLTQNGFTIKHKFVAWLQGESDGDAGTSKENYKTLFNSMLTAFKNAGVDNLLLIRIGKRSYDERYSDIIDAQTELCQSSDDIIMISTALSDFRRRGYMKDEFHYYQDGYNLIGKYAGHNAGVFSLFGIERVQYDSEDADLLYNSYKCD